MSSPERTAGHLARMFADARGGVRLRQAEVVGVATSGAGTVDLLLSGAPADSPTNGVRRFTFYTPTSGDIVWVLQNGPDLLVLGKLA